MRGVWGLAPPPLRSRGVGSNPWERQVPIVRRLQPVTASVTVAEVMLLTAHTTSMRDRGTASGAGIMPSWAQPTFGQRIHHAASGV